MSVHFSSYSRPSIVWCCPHYSNKTTHWIVIQDLLIAQSQSTHFLFTPNLTFLVSLLWGTILSSLKQFSCGLTGTFPYSLVPPIAPPSAVTTRHLFHSPSLTVSPSVLGPSPLLILLQGSLQCGPCPFVPEAPKELNSC